MKGMWLGFCIAAPVGPIGVLVLKESLKRGSWAGLASGFGAALADLTYGGLAVAGVRMFVGYDRFIALAGGSLLLWLAWKSWHEKPAAETALIARGRWHGSTTTTFVLTLSNPMTILLFAALVASAGADAPAWFVSGVFLGSMLWWTILSIAACRLRTVLDIRAVLLSRLAALTLAAFGIWTISAKGSR